MIKEEVLQKLLEERYGITTLDGVGRLRYSTAVELPEDFWLKAMDEYAKEVALAFVEFADDNNHIDGDTYTLEESYNLFLQSLTNQK